MPKNTYPAVRLRRLRQTESLRRLLGQPAPGPEKFIWPVFLVAGKNKEIPIESMPGQYHYSLDRLLRALEPLEKTGIGGLMLFGVVDPSLKSAKAAAAFKSGGLVQKAVHSLRRTFPDLTIFTDVCVCSYTNHGHCGILDGNGEVDNDATLELLAKVALSHAAAGAHGVAPSAMMDGQVAAIRGKLDEHNLKNTLILSYSTKFASSMYGPFRDAAQSAPSHGNRKSYQLPINDVGQAVRESLLDEEEGADILMVKPALFYLDIIAKIKMKTCLPLAAYNVSGEYAMLNACADRGWGDLQAMAREALSAISRAGADIIISYWANQYERIFNRA